MKRNSSSSFPAEDQSNSPSGGRKGEIGPRHTMDPTAAFHKPRVLTKRQQTRRGEPMGSPRMRTADSDIKGKMDQGLFRGIILHGKKTQLGVSGELHGG